MLANFIKFILDNLLLLQFVSLFISGTLLFFIIYFLVKLNIIGDKIEHYLDILGAKNISKRRTLKAWKQIQKRLKTREANQLKLAILECDRILHEIFKMAGYQGRNLDEIFEQITEAQISNVKEIRQVHKLRHRIANEPDLSLSQNEAIIAVEIYKKAFQELGLID
jgi:hypothetical protein